MGRKIMALALSLIMLIGIIPATAISAAESSTPTVLYSGSCGEALTWALDDAGELTISGAGNMTEYWYNKYSDKGFLASWYNYRELIKSITVNNGVSSISDYAFLHCSALKSVILPVSVTHIGTSAFSYCTSLQTISMPPRMDYLGDSAFENCTSLENIQIPTGFSTLNDYMFSNCESLKRVRIPSSITIMEYGIFENCKSLTDVNIPYDMKYLSGTFIGCSSLVNITLPSNLQSLSGNTFHGCSSLKSIEIPDTVNHIGIADFADCSSLEAIDIPEGVDTIEWYAFKNCSSLSSVTLPDSMECIEKYAFENCTALKSISIPENVTTMCESAFKNCTSLSDVYITDIDQWYNMDFFNEESNPMHNSNLYVNGTLLENLSIPQTITKINDYTFSNCKSIKSLVIHDDVTDIGISAFSGCTSLNDVSIGNNVSEIKNNAFLDCTSLTGVYINDIDNWYNIDFSRMYSNPLFYASNLYVNGTLLQELSVPETLSEIKRNTFVGCKPLTHLVIPGNITTICYQAFRYCSGLESVTIMDGVEKIDRDAFNDCPALTSITIPDSVNTITSAFSYLPSLTVYTPSFNYGFVVAKTRGNTYCFTDYSPLNGTCGTYATWELATPDDGDTVTLNISGKGNMEGFSPQATAPWYMYGTIIDEITIGNNIQKIGGYSFYNCKKISSITIPSTVISINQYAFYNCKELTGITIPDSVTTIDSTAFSGCDKLVIYCKPGSYAQTYAIANKIACNASCMGEHTWDSGIITSAATTTETGIMTYTCTRCGETRTEDIPMIVIKGPIITSNNYTVTCTKFEANYKAIRYAPGTYSDVYSIKNATGARSISGEKVYEGVQIEVSDGGTYTFYFQKFDDTGVFKTIEIDNMTPEYEINGLNIIINNIYGASRITAAPGHYTTHKQAKNALGAVSATSANNSLRGRYHKFLINQNYLGEYTIVVEYSNGNIFFFYDSINVSIPTASANGRTMTLDNLQDVSIVRYAIGSFASVRQLKSAPSAKSFRIDAGNETFNRYVFYDGTYTVYVKYTNGYETFLTVTIANTEPIFTVDGSDVTIGNLGGLSKMRYAPGTYTTDKQIKFAPSNRLVRPYDVSSDGTYTITGLAPGKYTFYTYYANQSSGIYTVTIA